MRLRAEMKVPGRAWLQLPIDAFPDREYTGEIIKIDKIGFGDENAFLKNFNVYVNMNGNDQDLRPGMTAQLQIVAQKKQDVLYVPLKSLFSTDSLSYVLRRKSGKLVKQKIDTGIMNAGFVVVEEGLNEGDKVMLTKPENMEKIEFD